MVASCQEQFYLLWPLLLLGALLLVRRWRGSPAWLILPADRVAGGSVGGRDVGLVRARPGPDQVYEGTDTLAFGLLIGAMLALAWPTARSEAHGAETPRRSGKAARLLLDVAGFTGLAVIGVLIWRVSEYSAFPYRGGLVLLSVATVAAVAATAIPAPWSARRSAGPLCAGSASAPTASICGTTR